MGDDEWPLARMGDDELREFVLGVCDGQIFTSAQVPDARDVPMVFMVLAMGALSGWSKEQIELIGCVWEWMREAGPRSFNGMPGFFSARLMHRDDWRRALLAVKAELDRRRDIELPPRSP